MRKVTSACDAAMPRRGNGNPHKPVYWWSDRISQLHAKCHKARRGNPTFPETEEKFKLARSKLTKAIKLSKQHCWTELLGVVEDPLGRPYKVVMAQLTSQSRQQPTCPEQLEKFISTLFPEQEPFSYLVKQENEYIPLITREEWLRTNKRIGNSKAPGMDNIPNVALNTIPETFLDMPRRGNLSWTMKAAETCTLTQGQQTTTGLVILSPIMNARFIGEKAGTLYFQPDRGRYWTSPSRQPVRFQEGKIKQSTLSTITGRFSHVGSN